MNRLEQLVNKLPEDLRHETENFVLLLLQKSRQRQKGDMTLSWRGALRKMRKEYTSVKLQHEISRNWATNVSSGH